MIDVSKLSQKDRWRLGFAIAAAGNLDGEDNSTNEFFIAALLENNSMVMTKKILNLLFLLTRK